MLYQLIAYKEDTTDAIILSIPDGYGVAVKFIDIENVMVTDTVDLQALIESYIKHNY